MCEEANISISVVVITKKTPLLILKRCIQSIREQNLPKIEIILLDANDRDSLYKEAIQSESDFFQNLTYLEIPERNEFVHGKNEALQKSKGDYITFISAQDSMPPTRLALLLELLQKSSDLNVIYTDMKVQQHNILDAYDYQLSTASFQYISQVVARKDYILFLGSFDPNIIAHCDDDLWFRLNVLEPVPHISSPETTITITPECYHDYTPFHAAIGYRQFITKYDAYLKKHKKHKKKIYQKIAKNYKASGLYFRYIQFNIKAFLSHFSL